MVPVCRACREPERFCQPLIRCVGCKRRYHAACYNPPPLDPINWTCKKCMQPDKSWRHNETLSTTTFATQNSASSTSRQQADSDMPRTGFSFTPHSSDASGTMGMRCSFRGCTSLSEDGGPLCDYHINFMISGSGTGAEKPSDLGVQPSKAKLHSESDSGSKGRKIRMTKTAPGPTFPKVFPSISKQGLPFSAAPKFLASPTSGKSAARRRSIISPGESPVNTGSPVKKKPRPASGSYIASNSSTQLHPYDTSPNPKNGTVKLVDVTPAQNGTTQRRSSKDNRNGIENVPFVETAQQHWTGAEFGSRHPILNNHMNGINGNLSDRRHFENGFPYSNGFNDRWAEPVTNGSHSLFSETSSLQADVSSNSLNGFVDDTGRGTYIFDNLEGPGSKASAKIKPAKRNVRKASSLKIQPRQSEKQPATVSLKPPLELQRERLAEKYASGSSLDALIYNQEGAAEPPPGIIVPEDRLRPSKEPRFFAHIDPRVHWSRPHSKEWHEKKQAEIKERGGRKANFGKAAERMRKQRLEDTTSQEELLPQRVRENPEWLRAQAWFKECSQKDWEKDKEATRRAEAEVKSKARAGERRR